MLTIGEVCSELQALGALTYVGSDGKVWTLTYGGEAFVDPGGAV